MRRLSQRSSSSLAWALPLIGLAACSDRSSSTDLNPQGPPMVRQVFVLESVQSTGSTTRERIGLAFGSHPDDLFVEEDGVVTTAVATNSQRIRVVLDELLTGHTLEELRCNDPNAAVFSRVPADATPDDVARCSGGADELGDCEDICIGDSGPIGILDANLDGAADEVRMIDYGDGTGLLGAYLECDGVQIPLDQEESFYNPSGNQLVPAGVLKSDGLGPAVVLKPLSGLRTSAACTIKFRAEVTDKEGIEVCAPPGGDIEQDCTPGDTSAITFNVEPLILKGASPEDGDTEVDITAPTPLIRLDFNALIDPATLAGITLVDGADVAVPFTAVLGADDASLVDITVSQPYVASTTYTLTVPDTLTDIHGGALPETFTITFTTTAM